MNRREFLRVLGGVTAGLAFAHVPRTVTAGRAGMKPNVVYILADDMGYGDVECYNPQSKIPTPNMNLLATQGMRFTDAHSPSSVCTPTRYGVLTGRYCWRTPLKTGALNNYEPPLIEPTRMTVASMLKSQGYRTACIGKWHLGMNWSAKEGENFDFSRSVPYTSRTMDREEESKIDLSKPVTGGPTDLGFDVFCGSVNCSTCNTPYGLMDGDRFVETPTQYYEGRYLEQRSGYKSPSWDDKDADLISTRKAIEFIRSSANTGDPFFVYLAASAPHEPCEPEVIPEFMRGVTGAGPRGDMVALVDWMVGQVMKSLQETGVADNTIMIVTSDNGAKPGSYNRYTYGHQANGDLRGYKGGIYEGGHRVPLIVRWPGVAKPGTISDQLVGLQDFMATMADVLGLDLPRDAAEDSISFLPAITQRARDNRVREDLIHHSTAGVFAIRKGDWKLIIDCDNSGDYGRGAHGNRGTPPDPDMPSQLYNLRDDPFEVYNRIEDEEDVARELRELAEKYIAAGASNRPV